MDQVEANAERGWKAVEVGSDAEHGEHHQNVSDTLANVHHYADQMGVNWHGALDSADTHYTAEAEEAREAAESNRALTNIVTALTPESARVVGLLVADWNDREDGPEDVFAADATWAEIREAFPLPACNGCGVREVPATTPVGVNDETDHAEHPLCAVCVASRREHGARHGMQRYRAQRADDAVDGPGGVWEVIDTDDTDAVIGVHASAETAKARAEALNRCAPFANPTLSLRDVVEAAASGNTDAEALARMATRALNAADLAS